MKSLLKNLLSLALITSVLLSCSPEENIDSDVSLEALLEKIAENAEVNRVTTFDIVYNTNENIYQAVDIEVKSEKYFPFEFTLGENALQNRVTTGEARWKVVCTNGNETICETTKCVADAVADCLNDPGECVEVCPVAGMTVFITQ